MPIDEDCPITALQAVALCFEKSEMLDGWAYRWCPMPSEAVAAQKFDEWVAQFTGMLGQPALDRPGGARRAEWPALRIKQAGRGIVLWVGAVEVYRWWEQPGIRDGGPLDEAFDWGPGDRGYRPARFATER